MKTTTKRILSLLLAFILMLSSVNFGALSVYASTGGVREKELVVCFLNYSHYSDIYQKQQVEDLPWDRISTINHVSWKIDPDMAKTGTGYPIISADPAADVIHFAAYEQMLVLYPEVKVVLSVGGWNDSKWFADMASTDEGLESFIDSCVETLKMYPWLSGIDINWQYPGTSRNAEGEGFTGSAADKDNFTKLMQGLREAFDEEGLTDKILTYCASTDAGIQQGPGATVLVDYKAVEPYIDRVNVITYDMSASGTMKGLHHTALHQSSAVRADVSVEAIVTYLKNLGVDLSKVNIGSPLYSQGWVIPTDSGKPRTERAEEALGKDASKGGYGTIGAGQMYWFDLKAMEADTSAWVSGYDAVAEAAYLYNTDPSSILYQQFYTYENERSLQAKLDYIDSESLGGLIVWNTAGDGMYELNLDGTFATTGDGDKIKEKSFPMLTRMARGLGIYSEAQTSYNPAPYTPPAIPQANPVGFWSDDVQWNPGDIAIYNDIVGESLVQTHIDGGETPETTWGYWNQIGTYTTEKNFVEDFGDKIPAWNDECIWYKGAIVEYKGRYFRALANTHIGGGENPETKWGYWTMFHQPKDWTDPEMGIPQANPVGFWSDDVQWNPGDLTICNDVIARCIETTTIGGWETPEVPWGIWYWEKIGTYTTAENFVEDFGSEIPAWNDDCIWHTGAIVEYEGRYFKALANTTIGEDNQPETTSDYWALFYAPPTYDVTVSGSYAAVTGAGNYTEGKEVTIEAGTRSGYTFNGWTTTSKGVTFANANSATTTFEMPANAVTVTANWTYTGGGATPSNPPASVPEEPTEPEPITESEPEPEPEDDGDGSVTLSNGSTIETPDGEEPVVNDDGSVTLPGGGTVKTPDGTVIDVPAGTVITDDGKISFPKGSGGGTITHKSGFTFNIDEDAEIVLDSDAPLGYTVFIDNSFDDMDESDWYYDDVMFAYSHGLMIGTSVEPMMFSPDATLTRSMVVTVLYRLAGAPDVSDLGNSFNDVTDGEWYADAVIWAAKNGIVNGYNDGRFGPNDSITRQDLAVILYRFEQFTELIPMDIVMDREFADWSDIGDYAKGAVNVLTMQGILNGYEDGSFRPMGEATRAEFAAILHRFIVAVARQEAIEPALAVAENSEHDDI